MAIGNREAHGSKLRRFEPIHPVLSSSTLSTSHSVSPQRSAIPTTIITDPTSPSQQFNPVASQPSLAYTSSEITTSSTPPATSASRHTSTLVAQSSHGISTNTLIVSIVVPIVLVAILVPLIVLLCLTCRRKRRSHNRTSHHSQVRMRSPTRQKELLAHRPRGKYGPSIMMRRPNSFSGFEFNFSRPRTVLSGISVRSPKAVTPMNASRSTTLASMWDRDEQELKEAPPMPRRPALSLMSKYASHDDHVPTGRWDSPGSSPPPPPYARTRPVTLAHPYIPPRLEVTQLPDTPRSLSPQLQVATHVEIQRLPGPYTPSSQFLRQPEQSRRPLTRSPPQIYNRSPLSEHREIAPTSANLSNLFVPSASPASTDMSGLSFDPSMWIAAYERDSVVNTIDAKDGTRMDPHQLV